MKAKAVKDNFSKVNPYDLGTVAHITQTPAKTLFGSRRSADVYSAGGKNSTTIEKNLLSSKHKKSH
ncbi:MAG TPA: hypothetical protein VGN63_15190 [Flavisolibacter sp.]|jgi:hypothetical protein|nr:hypothetical protein [Flavisolibacter sp.]